MSIVPTSKSWGTKNWDIKKIYNMLSFPNHESVPSVVSHSIFIKQWHFSSTMFNWQGFSAFLRTRPLLCIYMTQYVYKWHSMRRIIQSFFHMITSCRGLCTTCPSLSLHWLNFSDKLRPYTTFTHLLHKS